MNMPDEHNDIRLLLGAFDNNELVGVAFASFIDCKDAPENGIELNGLWVNCAHRNKGISLKLIIKVLKFFIPLGVSKIEVYNHRFAPSNNYYKKLGGVVTGNELQMDGKLQVDIFSFDVIELIKRLEKKMDKYV